MSELSELPAAEQTDMSVLIEAYKRWPDKGPFSFQFTDRGEAYILVASLQLVTRHPGYGFGDLIESVGRRLQGELCDQADVYALLDRGWNPAYDVASGS